jgi:uncharacterized protein YciI
MYYILFYKADADYIEKRTPFRPEHLALATKYKDEGKIIMAGALADPADGSAIVFKTDSLADVEEFAKNDPYVTNGVVKEWNIRPWNVVIGGS